MESRFRSLSWTVLAASATLSSAVDGAAQSRGSERGTVTQVVNGTTITIDFSRPVARGRTNLFGGVVHWGELWTPGANWATTLEVDRPVSLNGHRVAPGKYSIWMRPQPGEWTVFLNAEPRLYHDSPVPVDQHLFSFTVTPVEGAHMEALAWYFPVVGNQDASLRMHWGTTHVTLTIETEPFAPPEVPADLRARFAGSYAVSGRDPTTTGPLQLTLRILDEDGRLMGRWGGARVWLVPAGEGTYYIGFMREGQLFDMAPEMTVEFVVVGDEATGVVLRWEGGDPFARGDRITGGR